MFWNSNNIIEVNEYNFNTEVIEYSLNSLVIVAFWAKWSKPSIEYRKMLEIITARYGNQIRLALVDIDESPLLSSKFAVYTLPTLKMIYQGNIHQELIGYQPEFRVVQVINSIRIPDPMKLEIEKAYAYLNQKDYKTAGRLFTEILEKRPLNPEASFGLAMNYIHSAEPLEAYYILKDFPASPLYDSAGKLLPLVKAMSQYEAGTLPQQEPLDFAFSRAMKFAIDNKYYLAVDGLLEILKQDRNYYDQAVSKVIIGILELIPDSDPQKKQFRSELSTILF